MKEVKKASRQGVKVEKIIEVTIEYDHECSLMIRSSDDSDHCVVSLVWYGKVMHLEGECPIGDLQDLQNFIDKGLAVLEEEHKS